MKIEPGNVFACAFAAYWGWHFADFVREFVLNFLIALREKL